MGSWKKVAELVKMHKEARPAMRAKDAYKLLYQGVFGVGHIMGPNAWDYLQKEANDINVNDQPGDPLMESVSLDGSVIRVNLRPYIRKGYSLNHLMEAMRNSEIIGEPAQFVEIWDAFAELVWSGKLDFEHNEVDVINRDLDKNAPKPQHHTTQYREAYYPSYRVVRRREIFKILGL
jgi:hypothetical protein